jgi:hypothetical protein
LVPYCFFGLLLLIESNWLARWLARADALALGAGMSVFVLPIVFLAIWVRIRLQWPRARKSKEGITLTNVAPAFAEALRDHRIQQAQRREEFNRLRQAEQELLPQINKDEG